jgi:imidazolonepropionase-like amidohydrolase
MVRGFAILLLSTVASTTAAQSTSSILFRGVRVFDGTKATDSQDVLVTGDRIARVGRAIAPPSGARVIDGSGKTLLPGFIDAHTHTFGDANRAALPFGVTTELDMFTEAGLARRMRAEQAAGQATDRADLFSASILVTAPRGHGTQFGMPIPTLQRPESAQRFVDARIAEGSDWIKIVYDDGHAYGMQIATLDRATLRAAIEAAHKRGKLAVVHIGDYAAARDAIEAGADGLVHLFVDREPAADFGRLVATRKAFIIPTLTVNMSITGVAGGAPLASDPRTLPYLSRADSTSLTQAFPLRPGGPARSYAATEATVRQLKAAGVLLLAGSDAGNPGTAHGSAMHREVELLVKAGLTPVEALAAATSAPAKAFRLADRGRIAEGLRADLVLVTGDPTTDITATRAIEGVWKQGVQYDRAKFGAAMAATRSAVAAAPRGVDAGDISSFDDGGTTSVFGSGWMFTNDAMAGGKSSGDMKVVDGGAQGSAKSLEITGTIAADVPFAWAGAMFSPGAQVFAAANLSSKKELRFFARGDGQSYRVLVFAESKGRVPLEQTFVAGAEWKEHVFPFTAFGGMDGRDVQAIMVVGGPKAGPFSIRIDDVKLR